MAYMRALGLDLSNISAFGILSEEQCTRGLVKDIIDEAEERDKENYPKLAFSWLCTIAPYMFVSSRDSGWFRREVFKMRANLRRIDARTPSEKPEYLDGTFPQPPPYIQEQQERQQRQEEDEKQQLLQQQQQQQQLLLQQQQAEQEKQFWSVIAGQKTFENWLACFPSPTSDPKPPIPLEQVTYIHIYIIFPFLNLI